MGENLLSMEEVCKLLQLNEDQVTTLVKQGRLRGFLDQKTYKFRSADVEKYRKQIEAGGTVVLDDAANASEVSMREVTEVQEPVSKTDTSRIDLADVEGEPGADESDQTSVLAPVEDKEEAKKEPEPVFEFSEDDLGLSLDDDDGVESVLIADESESSVDILETVDESSSESAASPSTLDLIDEESESGDEVIAVADVADGDASDTDFTDTMLEGEESSDESIEPLDLDTVGETAAVEEIGIGEDDDIDTIPLVGETETVGVEAGDDDTKAVAGVFDAEEAAEAAEAGDGTETVGVQEDVLGEAVEGVAEVEEILPESSAEEDRVVSGWSLVVPWVPGNVMLAASLLFLAVGGILVFCSMVSTADQWGWAQSIIEFVEQHF